jgi:hypothetical protein
MITRQPYIPTNPGASASAEKNIWNLEGTGNDELTLHNIRLKRTTTIKG